MDIADVELVIVYGTTSVKNICIKLKGEVGMAVPKSTQPRVVGIIIHTRYISTLAFLIMVMCDFQG